MGGQCSGHSLGMGNIKDESYKDEDADVKHMTTNIVKSKRRSTVVILKQAHVLIRFHICFCTGRFSEYRNITEDEIVALVCFHRHM